MTVKEGRQWATSLSDIRADHVERYRWAAREIDRATAGGIALAADLGCGIGYGSNILAMAGNAVNAYDFSGEAIRFAESHWAHDGVRFNCLDLAKLDRHLVADWAVCFELIEHLEQPAGLLSRIKSKHLLCSVPNESVMPFDPKRHSYHHRHYTKPQFWDLLNFAGWTVTGWFTQAGKTSMVEPGDDGMTLIARCER